MRGLDHLAARLVSEGRATIHGGSGPACDAGKHGELCVKDHRNAQNRAQPATPVQGPCQAIWIPNWFPTPMNKLAASPEHWSGPARRKRSDRDIVAVYARYTTEALLPRLVSITMVLPKGKRLPDEDSLEKSVWDALVQCKRLVNDTPRWCRRGQINYVRALLGATPGTLLLLEDQ